MPAQKTSDPLSVPVYKIRRMEGAVAAGSGNLARTFDGGFTLATYTGLTDFNLSCS